jgi:branched-chain amino acid transport system permease protein
MGSILVTLGAALANEDLVPFVWTQSFSGIPYTVRSLVIGDVVIPTLRLAILLGIVVLTLMLHLFLRHTFVGIALRAMTQNRQGAMLVGINLPRLSMLAFGLGTALVATAGVAHVMLYSITPTMDSAHLSTRPSSSWVAWESAGIGLRRHGAWPSGVTSFTSPQWAPSVAFTVLSSSWWRAAGFIGARRL